MPAHADDEANDLAESDRMMHLILDCQILEIQAGGLKELLQARLESREAVTAEEHQRKTEFINRLVARLRSKAQNLYAALHQ